MRRAMLSVNVAFVLWAMAGLSIAVASDLDGGIVPSLGSAAAAAAIAAAAACGAEWRKQRNERIRQRNKEDKIMQLRDGGYNTPWTLERAFELCTMAYRCKHGAKPYPADSKVQIASWADFERRKIKPAFRTLLMNITECPPGTKEHSPKINDMQTSGKAADVASKRKRQGVKARSQKQMGRDQKNAVEGVAIHLLLCFLRSVITSFNLQWEVMPVYDGLEADFMMRKKDWPPDLFVPVQIKSASECIVGKQVSYNLKRGDYPNIFCVCVGMLGFLHRTSDLTGPNDITNAPGCTIGEIWNIGSCSNIETTLGPVFGVPYSKLQTPDCRLHFSGATDEAKSGFAEALLRNIEAWPTRLTRNRMLYECSDTINSKVTDKTEKAGFEVVDTALRTCGLYVDPVWRQGECVDYAVVSINSNTPIVFVSGKTGPIRNNDPKQRAFHLNGAPNKRFCDVVVACYSGLYHKVAVMSRDTAYVEGMKTFCWNESNLKPGVRVFDDIRIPEVARAFANHLRSFGAQPADGRIHL
jgi:hypothetical protein